MKLTVISDLHGSVTHVDALRRVRAESDALVVCGDFTTFGNRERIQAMADAVAVEGKPCYFVIGNCDTMAADGKLEGCHNLHGRVLPFGDWLLAGICGSLPCPSQTPSEFPESEFERLLAKIRRECGSRADRLILVSHQPPYGTAADLLPAGGHVGCRALRQFIDEVQPACCLCGHIHEAASRSMAGRTVVLNPGPFARGNIASLEL